VQIRERAELHRAQHRLARALRDQRVDQRENGVALPELIVHTLDPENRRRRGFVERRAVGTQRLAPLPRLLELERTHRQARLRLRSRRLRRERQHPSERKGDPCATASPH
jgi:hypothetical protein